MVGAEVIAKRWFDFQGLGRQLGGSSEPVCFLTHRRQGQTFGVILGTVFAVQYDGETLGHPCLPFRDGNPICRGVMPAGLGAAQLVGPSEHGERPGVVALSAKYSAENEVGLGVVGFKSDCLAVGGNGLLQLTLLFQGQNEAGISMRVVGLDPDRLAVGGDRLVQLPLLFQLRTVGEAIVRNDRGVSGDGFIDRDPVHGTAPLQGYNNLYAGIEPFACVEFGENIVKLAVFRQTAEEAAEMSRVVGTYLDEIAEHRDGLLGVSPVLQGMGQHVRRVRADRPRGGIEANGFI